jgi:nuclear transcription factor Y gamma
MVEEFWRKKQHEIEAIKDFGERTIPMTHLRKVICAEKGKMMMTFDTPSFLTKACEIFVQELSFRAWMRAKSHQRSIILDSDIAESILSIDSYDFLNDVLHTHHEERYSTSHPRSLKSPSTSSLQTNHQHPANLILINTQQNNLFLNQLIILLLFTFLLIWQQQIFIRCLYLCCFHHKNTS